MALVIFWYDFICFAIIAASISGSIWVIRRREGAGRCEDDSKYESLLAAQATTHEGFIAVSPRGHVGSVQLWTSCWRGVHPAWLLATRFVSAVAMAGFLGWDIEAYDLSIYVYYTEWTFTLVIVYFAVGTIVSAHGCWAYSTQYLNKNEERDGFLEGDLEDSKSTTISFRTNKIRRTIKLQSLQEQEDVERRAGFWGYLMQIAYQTSAGAVMLTDIVFWFIIVPFLSIGHFKLNLLMGSMHALNLVFLLLDTALNSLPFPWFRMSYFVLWSCLYVIFQWVLHACGFSWWPYPFLELDTPWAPLWYFCLALIHIPCYGLYYLVAKTKDSILSKLFPHAYIRSC
eukprot:TRINITY_DN3715_c0_g1_i2.p1 TRINITY_DN3715_c0_g1~~TRINITY_DN3715_c0_g1_i2.p1  ORF type:complete len:342 (-),score=12.44 TRINITY_DN3715_c0_g1_i2:264-1289(-)